MLGLVWLTYASFGLVSNSLAPVVTQVTTDLGLSYSQMGTILGAWQLTYIGLAYMAGQIIDRIGLRRALGIGVLVIAASALLRGGATGFWTLFMFVALFGLGGPMVSVGAPKLIATWFAGPERGKAAGIYTTGPAIGAVVVLSTANSILMPATGSWRLTVAAYGVVALAVGMVWWLLSRDPPPEALVRTGSTVDPRRLLRLRNVWLVLVIGFAGFLASHGLGNWLPRILQWHGFDPVDAGVWASIPNLVGIVGALTFSRVVPRDRRTHATAAMFATSAVALLLIGNAAGPPLILGLVLQGLVFNSITPLLMLVMMETPGVGPAAMGAAGGLYFTISEIGGFSGPSLLGYLFDVTGGFVLGLTLIAVLLVGCAGACLLLERQPAG
jgi:CP family cyanate transporter-like MFS transporter